MTSVKRIVAGLAAAAHLLSACSSATVSQPSPPPAQPVTEATAVPPDEPTKAAPESALVSAQLTNGWPAETPDLRDVVLNFKVIGDRERALSHDNSGFLVIRSEQTAESAKLIFYDSQRLLYRLPAHNFNIHSIGSDLICRDAGFYVPIKKEEQIEFVVEIVGHDGGALISFRRPSGKISGCRPQEEWAKLDAADGQSVWAKYDSPEGRSVWKSNEVPSGTTQRGKPVGEDSTGRALVETAKAVGAILSILGPIGELGALFGGGGR